MTAEEFLNAPDEAPVVTSKPISPTGGSGVPPLPPTTSPGVEGAKPSPTPVTFYSLGADVGGPDETQDKWTNKGFSSKGPNLTPGVAAVNEKKYPLGTVLKDTDSGMVFLATDRHGNEDPNVVDVYVAPENYKRAKVTRNFSVVGKVDNIPTTAEGVRSALAAFGTVPEGPSAAESLGKKTAKPDNADTTDKTGKADFIDVPGLPGGEEEDAENEGRGAAGTGAKAEDFLNESWWVQDDKLMLDPKNFRDGLKQAKAAGVIDDEAFAKLSEDADKVEAAAKAREELVAEAGDNAAAKAALHGIGKGSAMTLGALGAGAAGALVAPAAGPAAPLVPIVTGTVGLFAAGAAYDAVYKKLADWDDSYKEVLAAKELEPGWNAAGEMAFLALQLPASAVNMARAVGPVARANGTGAAVKFGAQAVGVGAGTAAVTDTGVRIMQRAAGYDEVPAPSAETALTAAGIGALTAGLFVGKTRYSLKDLFGIAKRQAEGKKLSAAETEAMNAAARAVEQLQGEGNTVKGVTVEQASMMGRPEVTTPTVTIGPGGKGGGGRVDLKRLGPGGAQEQFEGLVRAGGGDVDAPAGRAVVPVLGNGLPEGSFAPATSGGTVQSAEEFLAAPATEDPFAIEDDGVEEGEGYVAGGDEEALAAAAAARQAEADYLAEMQGDIDETMRAAREQSGSVEIADAVEQLGGLPGRGSAYEKPYAGELQMVRENVKADKRMKLFRKDAPDPDRLVTSLRDIGFEIEGPNQLWDILDTRFRGNVEHWSEPNRQDAYWQERHGMMMEDAKPRTVQDLPMVKVDARAVSGPEAETAYRALTPAQLPDRPVRVQFVRSIIGKLKGHHGAERIFQLVPHFQTLLEGSIPMDFEAERNPVKHDNVVGFQDYLAKADIGGTPVYVRFSVQLLKTGRKAPRGAMPKHELHSAFVSDVAMYDEAGRVLHSGISTPTTGARPSFDRKLAQWLGVVKEPQKPYTAAQTAERGDVAAKVLGTAPVTSVARELAVKPGMVDEFAAQEKLVALGWRREMLTKGKVDFVGRTIKNAYDLAQAAQVYRDPRFETVRWLFTRNGKVVDTVGITSRNPRFTMVLLPGHSVQDMVAMARKTGADGVWLLHNHPSGDPTPSEADRRMTEQIGRAALAADVFFQGHVVINGGRFAMITPDGFHELHALPGRDELLQPEIDSELLNLPVESTGQVAAVAEVWARLAADQRDGGGQVTLFILDTKRKVRAVTTVPLELFFDREKFSAYLHSRGSKYGVSFATAYYDHPALRDWVGDYMGEYIRGGLLDDGVLSPRETLRETGLATPDVPDSYFGEKFSKLVHAEEVREDSAGRLADIAVTEGPLRVLSADGKNVYATVKLTGLPDIKIIEMPEMLALTRQIMGSEPELRRMRSALGQFVGAGQGQMRLDPRIFADSTVAAKVFAHEIGHLVDYLPDHTLKRGNLIGRLYTLKRHLSGTAFGSITGIKNADIKAELEGLTRWWKPWDDTVAPKWYSDYRKSSVELYADAISVLFNSPAELKARAPKFYKEFFAWLDKKPEVKTAFFELQAFLHKPYMEVLRARSGRVREMFGKAEEIYLRHRERRRLQKQTVRGFVDTLKDELYDRFNPVVRRQEAVEKDGGKVAADLDMRKLFDEHPLADNLVYTWLSRVFERVVKPLEAQDITLDDMGEYLFFSRVMADRAGMANPQGHTAATARAALLRMRLDLGNKKFTLLERSAEQFHDHVFDTVKDAAAAGLISQETFKTVIEPNRKTYAAFRPIEHVEDYVPAGIFQQIGTLKEIENPWLTTILKTVAMRRAIQYNRAKVGTVEFLTEYFPDEIRAAETRFDGKRQVVLKPKDKERGLIEIRRDGQWAAYEVPGDVARMFDRLDPAQAGVVMKALNFVFKAGFYNLWVRWNPVFQLAYSPIRDAQRYYVNMPKAGAMKLAANYLKAIPAALDRITGKENPLITEMYETFALATPHDSYARNLTRTADGFDEILKQFHILPREEQSAWRNNVVVKPIEKLLRSIEFAGQIFEGAPKISAYKVLTRDLGYSVSDAAAYVRNYIGVPNYLRKGRHAVAAGSLLPFWNVATQGLASDGALMTGRGGREGKSAASWWFRWAMAGGIYAIVQALARSGLLGDDAEELFGGVSDYDSTNFTIIPLGTQSGGDFGKKVVYLRVPQDEMHRLTSGLLKKFIELTVKHAKDEAVRPIMNDLMELAGFSGGQLPGVNPSVGITWKWMEYANGLNPYDTFRGRHVLSNNEWLAGGWASLKPMLGMTFTESGLGNFYRFNPETDTTLEMVVANAPIIQRLVKVSDRGFAEDQRETIERGQAADARLKTQMPRNAQQLAQEHNFLRTLSKARTPEQEARYKQLREWNRRIYQPTMEAAEAQRDAKVDYQPTLNGLEDASAPWE